jgi:acetylserotonin O-methyltransferase
MPTARPSPSIVLDLILGFRRSKTMFAAVSLGIFDALESKPLTCAELVENLKEKVDPDALERLLDACVGLLLLKFATGVYENTAIASTYLSSKSPYRLTGYINFSNQVFWKLWEHLEQAIKTGMNTWKQAFPDLKGKDSYWDYFFENEEKTEEFLMGMHGYGQITSPRLVEAVDLSGYQKMVDLGGGTGHLVIAACKKYRNLEAIVFEVPAAVPLAKKITRASEFADRIKVVSGDFFKDPLPKETDLFAVARILHDWKKDDIIRLIRKVFDSLQPGGAFLIAEKLLNEDKRGPYWAQMQNLNMLTCAEGKERTFSEYWSLLTAAGFTNIAAAVTDSPLDVIMALKPAKPGEESLPPFSPPTVIARARTPRQPLPISLQSAAYFAFFDSALVGFVVADMEGNFIIVNQAFADIHGRTVEETLSMNYRDLTHEGYEGEDEEQMKELNENGRVGPFEKQYFRKDGTLVTVRVTLKIIKITGGSFIWSMVDEIADQSGILTTGGRVIEYRGKKPQ